MKSLTTIGVLAALALAGCGRMADLEAPPVRQTERSERDRWATAPADPATVNRPSTQTPIDGGPVNPLGAPAAGRDPQ